MGSLRDKLIIGFLFTLSLVGLFDASYLTYAHYTKSSIACVLAEGCDIVTPSPYAEIYGVPLAVFGIVFYLTVLMVTCLYLRYRDRRSLFVLVGVTSIGFLASVYFVYLQLFIILAICTYCMVSAATTTLLTFLSLIALSKPSEYLIS